ncbi:efflux RND transporter periplasmic adaptor subunit [Gilvimarinus sp. F26214L]|uniref:efflux RND transporter periplasmic adaptor subunit n=1 Tax=Gilvimarinus sp. DZF01 TaxID=3461371 RepID=UPI0040464BEE
MKKPLIITLAVSALLVGAVVFKESTKPDPGPGMRRGSGGMAVAVEVSRVLRQIMEVRAEAVGTAYARESVSVTANVSDTVETIHFRDGQMVEEGDVLVILSHNEEQAELGAAQANLAEQEREVKRLQGLIESKSVSQSLLDERITLRETAQHRVSAARARLRDRTIRAPFSGVLGLRQVSPGTLVSPGTVITTLDATDTMKLDFAVPSIHLGSLKAGQTVQASSPAVPGRVFEGRVASIDSRINEVDRSIKVRAEIPNADNTIKHGMLLHVEVVFAGRETLVVPESALVPVRDRQYVYAVEEGEPPRARMQEVEIGVRRPGLVEILSGLQEGQQVVTRGTHTVNNNSSLNIVRPAEG